MPQGFCPPNSHELSEDVIGKVLERKRPIRQDFTIDSTNWNLDHTPATEQRKGRYTSPKRNKPHEVASCVLNSALNVPEAPLVKMSLQEIEEVTDQTTMSKLQLVLKANRDCRSRIQKRYENRKKRAYKELEDSIPLLREQINQLQQQCDDLLRKKETLWSVSAAYFRIFENGIRGISNHDMDYLRGVFAADVDIGTTVGFDDLIANWKMLTELFPDIHTRLDGLTRIGTSTVLAKTITTITITEKALLAAFPHLVNGSNNGDGRRKQIVDKLLDQQIVMRGAVRFDWDKTHHRVDRLYTQMDMLSPILQLVGSLEYTALVFNGAIRSPDGNFAV